MRALVADSSAPSRISLRDVPEPVPSPGEVLVEVRAFSINRGELRMLGIAADGWRPGWDFAGILQSDLEHGPPAGARVVGIRQGGAWAERVADSQAWIAELPDKVSFAQAAALPTACLTALRILRLGPAILGRRVLVTGASGGVGRFAIQLAHLGGADVTAFVSSSSTRAAGLRQLGADEVVSDVAQLRGRFDLILESVGGDTLGRLVTMVDPQGTLVMFGNSSNDPTTFDVRDIYLDARIRLQGFELFFGSDPFGRDLAYLVNLVAERKLDP
jgi:NADPH:quinone reductase